MPPIEITGERLNWEIGKTGRFPFSAFGRPVGRLLALRGRPAAYRGCPFCWRRHIFMLGQDGQEGGGRGQRNAHHQPPGSVGSGAAWRWRDRTSWNHEEVWAKATKEVGVGGKEANGECAQYHARTRRFLSWTLGSRSGWWTEEADWARSSYVTVQRRHGLGLCFQHILLQPSSFDFHSVWSRQVCIAGKERNDQMQHFSEIKSSWNKMWARQRKWVIRRCCWWRFATTGGYTKVH